MVSPERVGDYELLFPLGHGGMASVHLARKRGAGNFERLVVIKQIHPHLASEPTFRSMLADETRLSSRIHHPNVVPAIDVVQSENEFALVLDYVEAVSFSELAAAARKEGAGLDGAVIARIVVDTLAGLHAAHEANDLTGRPLGIVHRDVSPQNILVGADGVARLIDFGIATAAERVTVTESGILKGKIGYMSPEQARHKAIDRRSDVFAAGAVLYQALCRRPVFRGETEASILIELLAGDIPEPALPDGTALSSSIRDVLVRALAHDPVDRFATAEDFKHALEEALPPAPAAEVALAVTRWMGPRLDARRSEIAGRIRELGAAVEKRESAATARVRRRATLPSLAVILTAVVAIVATRVSRRARTDSVQATPSAAIEGGEMATPSTEAPTAAIDASLGGGSPAQSNDAGQTGPGVRHHPLPRPHPTPRAPSTLHDNPYP